MKMVKSHGTKTKLLSVTICLALILFTQISTVNADILGGTRPFNAYNMIDVYVDPSCASYTFDDNGITRDYQTVFATARLQWAYANNTQFDGFNVVNYAIGVDIHKVDISPYYTLDVAGECFGYIYDYYGNAIIGSSNGDWDFAVAIAYKDTHDRLGFNYDERASTAAHEIGHTLKLDETSSTVSGYSVMRQGRQGFGPQTYDFSELSRKWPQ